MTWSSPDRHRRARPRLDAALRDAAGAEPLRGRVLDVDGERAAQLLLELARSLDAGFYGRDRQPIADAGRPAAA